MRKLALILAVVAGLLIAPAAQAKPTAAPQLSAKAQANLAFVKANSTCAEIPAAAQNLAASADKVTLVTDKAGLRAFRFYVPGEVSALAIAHAKTPNHPEGGYYWFYRSTTWIDWLESDPCIGPDGYAYGFDVRCQRSTSSSQSNPVTVNCNFDGYATLQHDYEGLHQDWDAPYQYRHYPDDNETTCADTGGYHFLGDTYIGEIRTWIRFRVRFLSIDHLSQPRKTTSYHLTIASRGFGNIPNSHGGIGVGDWLESKTPPSPVLDQDGNC